MYTNWGALSKSNLYISHVLQNVLGSTVKVKPIYFIRVTKRTGLLTLPALQLQPRLDSLEACSAIKELMLSL